MIPKIIHYCWFGGKPLPESARKYIASWRKYFPDYEIKEWNENNFDVNIISYTAEAYKARKYAFVSDFARFGFCIIMAVSISIRMWRLSDHSMILLHGDRSWDVKADFDRWREIRFLSPPASALG